MQKTDKFKLKRFVEAQRRTYPKILIELKNGLKLTDWMAFIFPQVEGLGKSRVSKEFAIKSLEEARAYLNHPVVGPRLLECAQTILSMEGRSALDIFTAPDDQGLQSCMTLFGIVSEPGSIFQRVLDKYFNGQQDAMTLWMLEGK